MSPTDSPNLSEKRINHYFELAKNASTFSDFKQHKLGCVLVYRGKVIAEESNTTRTNPKQKEYNRLRGFAYETPNNGQTHAELGCLLKTKYMTDVDWSKVSLFVYREHKNGVRGLAKPCPACRKAIIDRGIKRVYYTTEDSQVFERIE